MHLLKYIHCLSIFCWISDEVREIYGIPPTPISLQLEKYDKLLQTNLGLAKDHISKNMGGLSRNTNLNGSFLKKLLGQGVLTNEDIESTIVKHFFFILMSI